MTNVSALNTLKVNFKNLTLDGVNIFQASSNPINSIGKKYMNTILIDETYLSKNYNTNIHFENGLSQTDGYVKLDDLSIYTKIDNGLVTEAKIDETQAIVDIPIYTSLITNSIEIATENSIWREPDSVNLYILPSFDNYSNVKIWDWDVKMLQSGGDITIKRFDGFVWQSVTIANTIPLCSDDTFAYMQWVGETNNTLILNARVFGVSNYLLYVNYDSNDGLVVKIHSLNHGHTLAENNKVTDECVGVYFREYSEHYTIYAKSDLISDVLLLPAKRDYSDTYLKGSFFGNVCWVAFSTNNKLGVYNIETGGVILEKTISTMAISDSNRGITCINENEAWCNCVLASSSVNHLKIVNSDFTITTPTVPRITLSQKFQAIHSGTKWFFNIGENFNYVEDGDFTLGYTIVTNPTIYPSYTKFNQKGDYLLLENKGNVETHGSNWVHKPVLIDLNTFEKKIADFFVEKSSK